MQRFYGETAISSDGPNGPKQGLDDAAGAVGGADVAEEVLPGPSRCPVEWGFV